MAITTFIPTIWSARLLAHLDNSHVATSFVNRNYEGEITAQGDRVKINSIGDITIGDYTKNTDMADPEVLSTADQTLIIDQSKSFNFQVDDVDKVQAKGSVVDVAMQRAGFALSDVADKFIFKTIGTAVTTANTIGTTAAPIALTKDNAYEQIVKIKVIMDKNNVPTEGRKLAVPPEFHALLLLDNRFVGTGGMKAEDILGNGFVGKAAGFVIFVSNNLPVATGGKYDIIAAHDMATTYAEQIVSTEAYRMEKRFADGVKGLHVYGSKNTMPNAIAKLVGTFA